MGVQIYIELLIPVKFSRIGAAVVICFWKAECGAVW